MPRATRLRFLVAALRLSAIAFALPAGAAPLAAVVEYYHHDLDHYFITSNPVEIDDLDRGRTPGWARTGGGFMVPLEAGDGAQAVCRAYIPPAWGNSHFFSAFADECARIPVQFPHMVIETADAFRVAIPDATGACAAGTIPVYRLWNARSDTNHRYTIDATVRDAMLARGYVPEGFGPHGVTMCAATSSPALPLEPGVVFDGPIRITQGGTYSGNWQSLDPEVPAVTIATTQPVVIEHCTLRATGALINVAVSGVDATVRHCRGYGVDAGVEDVARGPIFEAYQVARLVFEHNYIEGTGEGVTLIEYGGSGAGGPAITIRYNRFRNLMGLYSDGKGGLKLEGDLGNEGNGNHAVILDKLPQLPGGVIAWNEFVMDPYLSSIGDKVNFYKSGGSAAAPFVVHDNWFLGGYGIFPTDPVYSGSGVITDGSGGDGAASASAFVKVHGNQFVNGANFGAGFLAGHDNEAWNNRSVSTGRLDDGRWMAAHYGNGFVVWNSYGQGSGFFNNVIRDNVAGWVVQLVDDNDQRVEPPIRQDWWLPDCATANGASLCTGNQSLPNPVTLATERAEWTAWQQKVDAAGVKLGPQPK